VLGVSAGSRAGSDGRNAPATQAHALCAGSATPGDGQRTGAAYRLAIPVPLPHAARGAGWPACAALARGVATAAAPAPAGRGRHAARCRCRACMRPLPKVMVAPATPRRTGARQY
ncbi:hypothetical protein PVAP13_4NG104719, partial [Panicum virgatum]